MTPIGGIKKKHPNFRQHSNRYIKLWSAVNVLKLYSNNCFSLNIIQSRRPLLSTSVLGLGPRSSTPNAGPGPDRFLISRTRPPQRVQTLRVRTGYKRTASSAATGSGKTQASRKLGCTVVSQIQPVVHERIFERIRSDALNP